MKELLFSVTKKDLDIQFFSGKGAGGQHRNKHQNCVRMVHKDSGVIVTGQNSRSRKANIKEAFNNLVKHPKFKIWLNRTAQEIINNENINQTVDSMMDLKNLKIEVKDKDGNWVEKNNI